MKKITLTNLFKKNGFQINKEKKLGFGGQVGDSGGIEMVWTRGESINKPPYYKEVSPLIVSIASRTKVFTKDIEMSFTIKDIEKVLKDNNIPYKNKDKFTLLIELDK